MTASLLEELEKLLRRPVSSDARRRAALHVMDWTGCAVAGGASPVGKAFRAAGEEGEIAVLGQATRLTPRSAAFVAGALGNVLEMDDVDREAILHPGPVVIPAALAAAQVARADPATLLDGIVRGYDAMIRLGRTVGPGHYAKFHNTATCGPIGAAAASAAILDLNPESTVWAMGNALTQASGFWACRHEDVMTKQLHTARAAEAGVTAAMLARAGVTGPRFIIEGKQGFYDGMCPDPQPHLLLSDPESWRIFEVSFKPWPACRHCHPAIDAALALRERVASTDEIEQASVSTYQDAVVFCDNANPVTTIEAKFSLQYSVALTLLKGRPDLHHFEAETRGRNDLRALCNKVTVRDDPSFSAAYPSHYGARLDLKLRDGSQISEIQNDALGDPELPMSATQLQEKADALMAWGKLPTPAAEQLINAAISLPDSSSLHPFLDSLMAVSTKDQKAV